MTNTNDPYTIPDTILAGGLMTAPAWGAWLAQLNQLLTTATLLVGLVLGCGRLWSFWRAHRRSAARDER